ncbi:hypothetical protein CYMTET_36905 [Cymbomonas tetramitiformis]|uniref:Uncharacterized protein n=1 Tax=Cymbomonas tetramitiformis TaxID=36881 RepID=A0AAE0CF32_9CHLO|nr:hypothetical protein CYMTET_36905 [Cymbomonas tetramitiformis]
MAAAGTEAVAAAEEVAAVTEEVVEVATVAGAGVCGGLVVEVVEMVRSVAVEVEMEVEEMEVGGPVVVKEVVGGRGGDGGEAWRRWWWWRGEAVVVVEAEVEGEEVAEVGAREEEEHKSTL